MSSAELADYQLVLIYGGCDMALYAFSLFLPSIINEVCHSKRLQSSFILTTIHSLVCSVVSHIREFK